MFSFIFYFIFFKFIFITLTLQPIMGSQPYNSSILPPDVKFFNIGSGPSNPKGAEAMKNSEVGPLYTSVRALHLLPNLPREQIIVGGVILATRNRKLSQEKA